MTDNRIVTQGNHQECKNSDLQHGVPGQLGSAQDTINGWILSDAFQRTDTGTVKGK